MSVSDREMLTRQIRDATDVVDLIGGYLTLRRAGANFKGLCPFHQEKTPSFYVSPSKQIFKCYGCGAGGDVFTFIQLREKVDFLEARRMLAERAGISLEREERGSRGGPGGFNKTDLARANQWALRVFRRNYASSAGEAARAYVEKRGISVEMAEAFGLGLSVDSYDSLVRQAQTSKVDLRLLAAAGLVKERASGGYYDTFRNRLMFPIADATGRIFGFGGRTLGDDPAKYLNTPATALFDKSTHLFALDRARTAIGEKGRAIVVEGYTDCIMAHQYGFTETVATLGTAMTDQHANLLRRYTDRVVLLFDSDEAGQRAADRALSVTLTGGLDVSLARVPSGKDPCDYLLSAGSLGFESVLKAAVPALEFKWHLVATEFQASATGPGRRRAIEAYLQQLSAWVGQGALDPIQTGLLVNQLSLLLALPAEQIHARLGLGARPAGVRPRPAAPGREMIDAEQEALRQILEVLLNDPSYYPRVAHVLDAASFRDPGLAAVAKELIALARAGEPFGVNDLIQRFELPSFGQLITDLQTRGERRGRFEEVITGALNCLHQREQIRRAAQAAAEIRVQRHLDPQTVEDRLLDLAASAKVPHFAPPRARRKFLE